jgi:hypothetical protein
MRASTRSRILWIAAAALVMSLGLLASRGTEAHALAPSEVALTSGDFDALSIAIDTGPRNATAVSSDQALSIASAYANGSGAPAAVVHGAASRTPADPTRSVWIALYPGGPEPAGGPAGYAGPPPVVDVTGVIVDDQTGEVLRWFTVSHY